MADHMTLTDAVKDATPAARDAIMRAHLDTHHPIPKTTPPEADPSALRGWAQQVAIEEGDEDDMAVQMRLAAEEIERRREDARRHDARVTELLEANNREVERRRDAERTLGSVLRDTARELGCRADNEAILMKAKRVTDALRKIARQDFNCSPHQFGMAAAGEAENALNGILVLCRFPPSYHDLYITTPTIPRTSIFNLPYGLGVECSRVSGWGLWRDDKCIAGEYEGCDAWLVLDVAGHVICDSRPGARDGW